MNYTASNAVNGILYGSNEYSETQGISTGPNQWWRVDLGSLQSIKVVELYSRNSHRKFAKRVIFLFEILGSYPWQRNIGRKQNNNFIISKLNSACTKSNKDFHSKICVAIYLTKYLSPSIWFRILKLTNAVA